MPVNPKSLKNLHPRIPDYEQAKKERRISLTQYGWDNLQELSLELGYRSRSALVEAIARGELQILPKNEVA